MHVNSASSFVLNTLAQDKTAYVFVLLLQIDKKQKLFFLLLFFFENSGKKTNNEVLFLIFVFTEEK